MAIGDGIRRNFAKVSQVERDRFVAALRKLDTTKIFPDGVSYWDKQDQIHQATHVHQGPAFLPWHRELCNRLEAMLREVDPDLSLHYWDWTTDPRATPDGGGGTVNLFSNTFMGSANGRAGAPLDTFDNNSILAGSRNQTGNPADPPQEISRNVAGGAAAPSPPTIVDTDAVLVTWGDGAPPEEQYPQFHQRLEGQFVRNHDAIHGYIGGTIGIPHSAFEDPFVFLIHSNVDRLWAMWQTQPGKTWRLDPDQVYGNEGSDTRITENLEPWAGVSGIRPWAPPENQQVLKNSKHTSVVHPPCYDTLPTVIPVVTLETPTLTFNDVPQGETTARAIVFSALGCDDVHLSITAGPMVVSGPAGTNFGTILGTSKTIQPHAGITPPKGRLWITYMGTNPNDLATGTVTVHCTETNQDFVIPITANTIARPTVAVCLALDQSGSMDDPAGTLGATRIQVLREAASRFVDIVQPNNGVGIVRFDEDAHAGIPITQVGAAGIFDPNRAAILAAVQAHATNPNGWTSVGDGVALARTTLNPAMGYDYKSIIIFTDGIENRPQTIADVAASIDNRTFAIGLGTETQVNTVALNALTQGTGGKLLLTGLLTASIDDYFLVTKYFLQILAGVTNNQIVLDPNGYIAPGVKIRIPFTLNEADIECTAILLTDLPVVQFLIEAPDGNIMDPTTASGLGQVFATGTDLSYYRFTLPLALGAGVQAGIWYAVLSVDEAEFRRHLSKLDNYPEIYRRALAHGARYSFTAQTYSSLKMEANLSQSSFQPGAILTLRANLTEYGLPVERRADVQAELQRPDNSNIVLSFTEIEPGVFETTTPATLQGIYHFRVMASGVTLRNTRFAREQTLTGAVFQGGDNPPPTNGTDPRTRDEQLCRLINCLLENESIQAYFRERNIELESVAKCVNEFCYERLIEISEGAID